MSNPDLFCCDFDDNDSCHRYSSVLSPELTTTKPICALCYTDIDKASDGVTTTAKCKHSCHVWCVMTRLGLERRKDAAAAVADSCPVCQPAGLISTLQSINARLGCLDETSKKIDPLVGNLQVLDAQVDKLSAENAAFKAELSEVRGSVVTIRGELDNVVKDTASTISRLQAVETQLASGSSSSGLSLADQATLLHLACRDVANQLVISGVPEAVENPDSPAEDLKELVMRLSIALELNLSSTEILRAERMGRKVERRRKRTSLAPDSGRPRSRAILLEMSTRTRCDEIIAAKKRHPNLCASTIASWYPKNKVDVNHRHPAQLHKLRSDILKRFPDLQPRSVWIHDEAVYFKKDNTSKPVRVVPSTDLAKLSL